VGDIGEGLVVLEGTRVVYANETFQKMTGYSEEQLLNISSFFNLLEGSDKARQQEKIAAFRKNPRKPLRFESPQRNDAGKPMTAEITLTVLKDDPQDRMVGLVRDVTDQKRLMEAVKDQEVQYKLLFKNNPSPMFIYDLENLAILSVNDAAILKYGFTEKEFLSMSLRDLRRAEDIPQMLEQLEGLKRGGNVLKEEVLHRKKDGSLIEVEVISHSTLFEGRSARVMLAYDLTEHRKAENALRESERRLSAVVTNAPIILFTLDMDGKVALSEGSGLKSLRLKPGGLVGKSAFDLYKDNPAMISLLRRAIGGESVSGTVEIGGLFFETRCSPLAGDDGKPQGVLGMAIDVTETKRAEQALVDSERKFRELFNNANDAIFLYPLSDEAVPGKFLEVNDIACQKLGYSRSELLHMTPLDVVAPEGLGEMPKIYKRSLKQEHITYEKVHVTKSGMKIPVEVNAHTFLRNGQKAVLSIARDVTDRKRAEETIRRQAYYDVLTN
ncbi:MAG TPA: PAS domain S-box protein, partial [bacterium]|nr:PAS domain S-box protein [bacterium]